MDEKSLKPKYEAPRIISMEEIGGSIGGTPDPKCENGSYAYGCSVGSGVTFPQNCSGGSQPT
jgi:hypothetical protein